MKKVGIYSDLFLKPFNNYIRSFYYCKELEGKLMYCEICKEFETKTFRGLSLHVKNKHNFDVQKYYDLYMRKVDEGVCVCGNPTKFISMTRGYFKYCSPKCSSNSIETITKKQQTKLEKYGNINYVNKEKSSKTWKNKSIEDINEIVNKRKNTKKAVYGDENFTNRNKSKETCLEKYGNENYTNREKFVETCLEKYGVVNVFELDETKEKIKQYFMDNFGVDHPMKVNEIKKKTMNSVNIFYRNKNIDMFKDYFKIIEYKDENNIYVECKDCGSCFWIQKQYFMWRYNKKIHPCYKCYSLSNISVYESDLLNFIKDNYDSLGYKKKVYETFKRVTQLNTIIM
jgi:hypothetical protein